MKLNNLFKHYGSNIVHTFIILYKICVPRDLYKLYCLLNKYRNLVKFSCLLKMLKLSFLTISIFLVYRRFHRHLYSLLSNSSCHTIYFFISRTAPSLAPMIGLNIYINYKCMLPLKAIPTKGNLSVGNKT